MAWIKKEDQQHTDEKLAARLARVFAKRSQCSLVLNSRYLKVFTKYILNKIFRCGYIDNFNRLTKTYPNLNEEIYPWNRVFQPVPHKLS